MFRSLWNKKDTAPAASEAVVVDKAVLQAIAAFNGGCVPRVKEGDIFPVSAAIRKAKAEILNNPNPGDLISGQGVYLGKYRPLNRKGVSLGKTFNVFAAPEDLPKTMSYVDTVKYIAELEKWHGFDGTNYPTDKEIYAALKNGSYNGGWIIPTRELLGGTEPDGKAGSRNERIIQPDNLFDHRNQGAFNGTFKTAFCSGSDYPRWYWSSTEGRDNPSRVWNFMFSEGVEDCNHKNDLYLSCRPVRLVEVLDG